MSKKISLGVAATIAIIAMAVTFSLTMVVSMKMFNTTVSVSYTHLTLPTILRV